MRTISPLAKIVVTAFIGMVLLLSLDPVSAGVALILELGVIVFSRLNFAQVMKVLLPVWLAVPFAGLATLLYGRGGGSVLLVVGPVTITEGNLYLAIAIMLRLAAIAVPAVILFSTTDSTDLADALAQIWKLPERFVISALAAVRMVTLLGDDWRMLGLARRARGLADTTSPLQVVHVFFSQALALMIFVMRRGSLLATAMEARGFDAGGNRTWARKAQFTSRDSLFVLGGVALVLFAATVSVWTGAWNFVLG